MEFMKTIKVLALVLMALVVFGCTKDDRQTEELEQLETVIKDNNSQITEKSSTYGMPYESWHSLNQAGIIKIKYNPIITAQERYYIREAFYELFPSLVVVRPTTNNALPEYWFVKNYSEGIYPPVVGPGLGAQNDSDSDFPLQIPPEYTGSVIVVKYELITATIEYSPFLDLYDAQNTGGSNNSGTGNTGSGGGSLGGGNTGPSDLLPPDVMNF